MRAALPCTVAKRTLYKEKGRRFGQGLFSNHRPWKRYLTFVIPSEAEGSALSLSWHQLLTTALPLTFVIPSEAEGSAVRPGSRTNVSLG